MKAWQAISLAALGYRIKTDEPDSVIGNVGQVVFFLSVADLARRVLPFDRPSRPSTETPVIPQQ